MIEVASGEFTRDIPQTQIYKMHSHLNHEILLFVEGDTDYIIDGNIYPLEPYDLILVCKGEMHMARHRSKKQYARYVFSIDDSFLEKYNCLEYTQIFYNKKISGRNKISAEVVKKSGLADAFERWRIYTDNGKNDLSVISKCIFIEILHILNNLDVYRDGAEGKSLIRDVITYINRNFTSKITLDDLAKEFFISKYHLCRVFKDFTGHTVINYINHKRIERVNELYNKGMSINNSAIESGFSSYSSFYNAYLKEYGTTPKNGMDRSL